MTKNTIQEKRKERNQRNHFSVQFYCYLTVSSHGVTRCNKQQVTFNKNVFTYHGKTSQGTPTLRIQSHPRLKLLVQLLESSIFVTNKLIF